jgi:endonuclease/exonuclease/phosphatase family metal-dependent hydrolase
MKFLKYLLWLVLSLIGLFAIFLLYSSIDNYSPPPIEQVATDNEATALIDSTFSIVTWNIGYAGLDKSMDFFYDGGENVRPDEDGVQNNLKGILKTVDQFRQTDFILLQEVDKKSKRSYRNNIYELLTDLFSEYASAFGKNYDVAFVPLPPSAPMGKVVSGLQTLSLHTPAEVQRYSFEGNYSWPMSVFMLDRCFLMNRYPLSMGKELVIINTHNSAYDDGTLRKQQMDYLKGIILEEYSKGNYVVVGGDWNQCPPSFKPQFEKELFDTEDLTYIEEAYPDTNWSWAYDAILPTNRRVIKPYVEGETLTTLIDFFLLSPNIELLEVHGIDLDFEFSDHQPSYMTFKLQ